MNDENNMFGEHGQPPVGGVQPQAPDARQDLNPVRLDKANETGGPVRLDKDGRQTGNGVPAGYSQRGYGSQAGNSQEAYGVQPGNSRPPYGSQPGNSQEAYGVQPGNGQEAYGVQAGNGQEAYGVQPGNGRPPYGSQPGYHQEAYGSQPESSQQPYGGQNQSTPLSGYAEPVYQQESQSTVSAESGGFGIASMVCGILSIISCCVWCVSLPLAIVSIIMGILQISKGTAKGMAIAGIICSAVGLLLMLSFVVWFVVFQASESYYDLMREMQYMNYRYHR